MVELGQSGACRRQRALLGEYLLGEPRKDFELERKRPVGGLRDARLKLSKFGRREAHAIGQGLAMDEDLRVRWLAQDRAVERGDLDEIAEHVVVAHLQRFDAGCLGVSRLQ